jgi:hypothetical protein
MPLMAGSSLGQRLKSGPQPSIAESVRIARETAEGLAAAHARGVVHRDVKPDNIWLEESADGCHVRLLDFGLARHDGASPLTQSGAIFGTPAYMAPEQADGAEIDARADLFSVGCVLYEMATGRRAFAGSSLMAILSALANQVPEPAHRVNPETPQSLSRLIDRLLAKKPADRPASAAEVVAALRDIEETCDRSVSFKPSGSAEARLTARRPMVSCQVTILAAALLFAPLAYFTWQVGDRSLPGTSSGDRSSTSPLKILSVSIKHFAPAEKDEDVLLGLLGETSFAPRRDEKVQIFARFSGPAYSYLLAFRPDGEIELCHPASDDLAPPASAVASYPADEDAKTAYGLREGEGLWIFAVIASDRPLPAFKEWIAKHDPEWKPRPAPPATVWRYDGASLKTLQENSSTVRGKDETIATGAADAVLRIGKKLESFGVTVGVVGFAVAPRP